MQIAAKGLERNYVLITDLVGTFEKMTKYQR